jgi:hypothetical protein
MQPTNQNPFQASNQGFNPQPMQDIGPPKPPENQISQAAPPTPVAQQQFTQNPASAPPAENPLAPPPVAQTSVPVSVPVTQYAPPAAPAYQAPVAPAPVPGRPEVVQSIPVREQNAPNLASAPAPQPVSNTMPADPFAQTAPQSPAKDPEDTRIEQILQDVNSAVKNPEAPAKPAKTSFFSKLKSHKDKVKAPVGLAVVTCVSLSMAAYFAFHQSKTVAFRSGPPMKLVGTSAASSDSIKAGGGTLISPADIDDFNKNTQTQLDKLNDSGDFESAAINAQALGL